MISWRSYTGMKPYSSISVNFMSFKVWSKYKHNVSGFRYQLRQLLLNLLLAQSFHSVYNSFGTSGVWLFCLHPPRCNSILPWGFFYSIGAFNELQECSLLFNQLFATKIRSISISSPCHFYFVLYCFPVFSENLITKYNSY